MSGGGPGGAPNLALTQKHPPQHTAGGIQSGRHADFTGPAPTANTVGLKFGIRVKVSQTPTLVVMTRQAAPQQMSLIPLSATDPVVADLTTALGLASDEKWVAFTATWKKTFGLKFDSELTLDNFDTAVGDNGFQIVTVAFCHDTQTFTDGVYSYAVSVLPGKNTTAFPLGALKGSVASAKKKSGAKKKSASKKKSVAKKKTGAKKKAKR